MTFAPERSPETVDASSAGTKSLVPAELRAGAQTFLRDHPELRFVDVFLTDLNGVQRGKRLPAPQALKVFDGGFRMPRSLVGVDIWGEDVFENGLILESGDSDGLCLPHDTGLLPCPWAQTATAQLSVMMAEADGSPFDADPRQLLMTVQDKLRVKNASPVVALEVEFYLFPKPPAGQSTEIAPSLMSEFGSLCDLTALDEQSAFIDDLYATCEQQGIQPGGVLKESGPGQFELNLLHQPCAVKAADQVMLLRRAIKGIASKHGLIASFMAKPFGDRPGSGMHAHLSLIDRNGQNVFAEPSAPGDPDQLIRAIAGLLKAAPESMIFFAPHFNSAKRYQTSFHAPVRSSWGKDNRLAAIRVPNDAGQNRRLEHRIAGADANPYLVLAAILAGVMSGLDNQLTPQAPLIGSDYQPEDRRMDADWQRTLQGFEGGTVLSPLFGPRFTKVFSACKRQEIATITSHITGFEYSTYLRAF